MGALFDFHGMFVVVMGGVGFRCKTETSDGWVMAVGVVSEIL
jgi:hypothetical protein